MNLTRPTIVLGVTLGAALLAPTAAHADVTDLAVTCNGATGRAGSFVTRVYATVDGAEIASTKPSGTWSLAWHLEGDRTVTIWDRTAGNDWDREHGETGHGGPDSNVVRTVALSCPVTTTTTLAPTTTAAPTTTTTPSTTEPTASTPVETTVVEPSTTVELPPPPRPNQATTTTTGPLETPPPPVTVFDPTTSTNYSGLDDFHVAATTSTTTVGTPDPSDPVDPRTAPDTTTPTGSLASTGWGSPWLLVAGLVALALGAGCLIARHRARPPFQPRP